MKRLLLACGLVGAIASAQAQPEHPEHAPFVDAQKRATQMQKGLQLTDEQTAKVKTILENAGQQRKALMDKYKPQFEAFHAEQKTLHDQTHQQISGVLTPKQLVALQEYEKHRPMHRGMHGEHGPDGDHHGDRDQPGK